MKTVFYQLTIMKIKKIEQVRPQSFLADILSDIDEKEMKRTENRMLLAMKISETLKQKHISQKEFAKMMGKSPVVVFEWLSGDRNFTINTLTNISVALGVIFIDTDINVSKFPTNIEQNKQHY